MRFLQILRYVVLLPLAVCGLTALFRVPHGALWKVAVAATEWGHVLAVIALAVAIPIGARRPDVVSWVALGTCAALVSPWVRSFGVASHVKDDLDAAFGASEESYSVSIPGLGYVESAPVEALSAPGADGTLHRVDWYRGRAGAPLVVAIHGGSWNSGDPGQLPQMYHRLAARGYHVAAITYRLVPVIHPAQRDDIAALVEWTKHQSLGHDPHRIVLYGRSAGGHLALLHATTANDPSIVGTLALYPVTDLRWSWEHPTNPRVLDSFATIGALLGVGRNADPHSKAFESGSPMFQLHPGIAPMLLAHGGRDELVFHEQSRRFVDAAKAAGLSAYLLTLPWATHGFEANLDGPSGRLWVYAVDRFLARYAPLAVVPVTQKPPA